MKKIASFFSALAIIAALMTMQSCAKTCDSGYEGSDCKTEVRAKYFGNWTVNGTDNGTPPGTYTGKHFAVSAGSTINELTFTSVDLALVFPVTLSADGKTFAVNTTVTGSYTYTGSGSFTSANAVNLSLTEVGGTPAATTIYTFTGVK